MPTAEIETTRARRPFAERSDVDAFVDMLGKFERGELGVDGWRAFRLVHGTYGQRQQGDVHMLRVKIPEGVLTAAQLEALADVAERYSRGFGHVTTRQNLQLHFVRLADAPAALRRLAEAGITTREACGNSVRNVTACALAGVAADEAFDVTPYAEALTRHFLRHRLSSSLPRKFKVAFEGCSEDHAAVAIHDLGFRAVLRDGAGPRHGFRVLVGGGTATLPVSAHVLFDFLPAGEILDVAEAVVRVFHALGDRQHRERNRLKFLVRTLGWERFQAEVHAALAAVRADGGVALPFDPEHPPVESAPAWLRPAPPSPAEIAARVRAAAVRGPGIAPEPVPSPAEAGAREAWVRTNVRQARQHGYAIATVTLPLGDVTSAQLRAVADLARAHGDGQARFTDDQNLLLRWVPEAEVAALYRGLAAAGLGAPGAGGSADPTSCPGAETCRIAVTQSRGLARLLGEHARANPRLSETAPGLSVKVSGCPNGCARHHVADVGFQGSARKVDGKAVPQYFVLVGGGTSGDGARFGRLAAKVVARRVPEALERLVDLYARERRDGESASAYFARVDLETARAALAGVAAAPVEPVDLVDLGDAGEYRQDALEGECAA